jgi:hypothetical protein
MKGHAVAAKETERPAIRSWGLTKPWRRWPAGSFSVRPELKEAHPEIGRAEAIRISMRELIENGTPVEAHPTMSILRGRWRGRGEMSENFRFRKGKAEGRDEGVRV